MKQMRFNINLSIMQCEILEESLVEYINSHSSNSVSRNIMERLLIKLRNRKIFKIQINDKRNEYNKRYVR